LFVTGFPAFVVEANDMSRRFVRIRISTLLIRSERLCFLTRGALGIRETQNNKLCFQTKAFEAQDSGAHVPETPMFTW